MNEVRILEPLTEWLTQAGFPGAEFETQRDLLVVKLDPSSRSRLLSDSDLRSRLVAQARSLGFSRLALDLTPPFV